MVAAFPSKKGVIKTTSNKDGEIFQVERTGSEKRLQFRPSFSDFEGRKSPRFVRQQRLPNVFRRTNFDFAELVADLALLIGDLCVAFASSSFDERQKINSRQNVEGGLVSDIANGDSKRNLSSSVE